MRSIGDLMKDMGFNAEAPVETQKAFIRHLIRAANGAGPATATPIATAPAPLQKGESQMSFDPDILGVQIKKSAAR
ncbi:MAG: hypothetical protein ACXVA9_12295 [Bdellovibrionales bacterium]